MVLSLPRNRLDYHGVDVGAEIAQLLELELLATIVENEDLLNAAGLSCVRELRRTGEGWQPIDPTVLAHEIEMAANGMFRLFNEAVKARGVKANFDVARGSLAGVIGSLARAGDIVAVIEPSNPADRITQQFTTLIDAAFRSAAAVMMIPSRVTRRTGPIVALVGAADDPSIALAATIAAASKEELILVPASKEVLLPAEGQLEREVGRQVRRLTAHHSALNVWGLETILAGLKERLLVMSRNAAGNQLPLTIASLRSIPVLVVESWPPHAEGAAGNEGR
jgi:hypothetical protein